MERNVRRTEKPVARRRGSAPAGKPTRAPAPQDPGVDMEPRRLLMLLASAAVIAAGFVALALGSTTLAPILLVFGYMGAIPYALIARRRGPAPPSGDAAESPRVGSGG